MNRLKIILVAALVACGFSFVTAAPAAATVSPDTGCTSWHDVDFGSNKTRICATVTWRQQADGKGLLVDKLRLHCDLYEGSNYANYFETDGATAGGSGGIWNPFDNNWWWHKDPWNVPGNDCSTTKDFAAEGYSWRILQNRARIRWEGKARIDFSNDWTDTLSFCFGPACN